MALPDEDVDREYHYGQLTRHCRVCSHPFKDKAYRYACAAQKDTFWEGIDISITTDSAEIHPPSLCNNCFAKIQKKSPFNVYKWEPHTAPTCTICELFRSQSAGGRPKRERKNRGCPKKSILTKALQDIEEVAPPSWSPSKPLELARFLPPAADLTLSDLQCKLCRYILDRPVQMRCGKLVCLKCLEQYWQKNGGEAMETYPCPLCDNASHDTAPTPAADFLVKVIGALQLHCSVCRETVRLEQLNNHLKSNCTDRITAPSPSKLTVGQILCRPTDAPPTPTEKKVATSVIKRLLHTSDSEVVSLPTAGQVYTLYTIGMGECIINTFLMVPAT